MIPAGVRIFVCTEPVDMRRGFDRLAQTARDIVGQDPQQGGALVVDAGDRLSPGATGVTRRQRLQSRRNGRAERNSGFLA
jgi:hypothetical protein